MSPHGAHLDIQATAQAGYTDLRSFRATDGREFLFGVDKTRRRRQIYERDNHRCTKCGELVSFDQMHWDHDESRSARGHRPGGDDSLANGLTKCQNCHIQSPTSKHA